MSDFEATEWADPRSAASFMDDSSRYVPDRGRTQELLASLLSQVLAPRFPERALAVLELGCGDAVLSHALMLRQPTIALTLLDGSKDMLAGARKRFGSHARVRYLLATFQDVIAGAVELGAQHFVVSSLALHHLTRAEKAQVFASVARVLEPGGAFVNVDVVLSPADYLEDWYLHVWREWIRRQDVDAGDGRSFTHIPTQYEQNEDNLPDTLQTQLRALSDSGLEAVDVFFKNGLFAVYGGFKPRPHG